MGETRTRSWMVRAVEVLAGTVLGVAFLLVLLWILNVIFPDATELGALMRERDSSAAGAAGSSLHFPDRGDGSSVVAVLTAVRRDVKSKPAASITWSDAPVGTELEDRDAVQSYDRSGAMIRFDEHNRLRLGEKTLIIVRRPERGLWQSRSASVLFVDGTLQGTLAAPGSDGELDLEVVTAQKTIRSSEGAEPAEIALTVHPDQSATLTVYDGSAEIEWEGETRVIEANEAVSFDELGPPGETRRLPARPRLVAPETDRTVVYRSVPPQLGFRWATADRTQSFRLRIARDPEFEDLVHEERIQARRFVHGDLKAGRYYWDVLGLDGEAQGLPSLTGSFEVVLDQEPPSLVVQLPQETVHEPSIVVRGSTEPGSHVFIGGTEIPIDASGDFEHALSLRHGYNIIVVQAIDAAGNTAFESHTIDAELSKPKRSS